MQIQYKCLIILFVLLPAMDIVAQNTVVNKYHGIIDHALPTIWEMTKIENDLAVKVKLIDGKTIMTLEGTFVESDEVELYEYNENGTVISSIDGKLSTLKGNLVWYNKDRSHSLPIHLEIEMKSNNRSVLHKFEKDQDVVFLRPMDRLISIQGNKSQEFKWHRFSCEGSDCVELRNDLQRNNPLQFELEDAIVDPWISIKDNARLKRVSSLTHVNRSLFAHAGYLTINYPVLENEVFDKWVQEVIQGKMTTLGEVLTLVDESNDILRLSAYSLSDYFITTLTSQFISGFLIFESTQLNSTETVSFIFDRSKNRFLQLSDMFKKDFDYAYFLNRTIDRAKKNLVLSEPRVLRNVIERASFPHVVLTSGGLVFFTDHNQLYGRRKVPIPHTTLESFLDNNSLESFFKSTQRK